MNIGLILAGGSGTRMGADIPKQYLKVRGKPIIAYTLEVFETSPDIDAIEVVCAPKWMDYVRSVGAEYHISKLKWINESGPTCQDSIRNGIFAMKDRLSAEDVVLVHMSVSPLVTRENLAEGIRVCKEKGNAFALQPCLFCMCRKTTDEWSDENAYKEDYGQLNMPWIMKFGDVLDLYEDALKTGRGATVKDYLPSLLFESGKKTWFYPDNEANRIKITTKGDLDLFEAYLTLMERRKGE